MIDQNEYRPLFTHEDEWLSSALHGRVEILYNREGWVIRDSNSFCVKRWHAHRQRRTSTVFETDVSNDGAICSLHEVPFVSLLWKHD